MSFKTASYEKLLAKHGIEPPLRTVYGKAESLDTLFKENQFDLVHAQNCIDHSFNPLRAFEQMVKVVKPGRFVIAIHLINEGENEGYAGLHQWNFYSEDGNFLMSNRVGKIINISKELSSQAETTCDFETIPGRLVVRMKKAEE